MGYGAGHADCVDQSFVKKQCPKEFKAFLKAIEDSGNFDFDCVARAASYDQVEEDCSKEILEAYVNLTTAFEKKTGLSLYLGFHDKTEEGDRYDDVDGAYFWVDKVFTLTPAGKKYQKHITRCNFVQFS